MFLFDRRTDLLFCFEVGIMKNRKRKYHDEGKIKEAKYEY